MVFGRSADRIFGGIVVTPKKNFILNIILCYLLVP